MESHRTVKILLAGTEPNTNKSDYNEASHIRPQNYPFPLADPQTPLLASSLDQSDLPSQTASGSDPPFFHSALDRHTDPHTDPQTDRWLCGKIDDYRPLSLFRQQRICPQSCGKRSALLRLLATPRAKLERLAHPTRLQF